MVGQPDAAVVREFEFDDDNISHLAAHNVSPEDVFAVHENRPRMFRNLPGRGGTHVMLGPDASGRYYYVAMVETAAGRWRPITGWTLSSRRGLTLYSKGTDQ